MPFQLIMNPPKSSLRSDLLPDTMNTLVSAMKWEWNVGGRGPVKSMGFINHLRTQRTRTGGM